MEKIVLFLIILLFFLFVKQHVKAIAPGDTSCHNANTCYGCARCGARPNDNSSNQCPPGSGQVVPYCSCCDGFIIDTATGYCWKASDCGGGVPPPNTPPPVPTNPVVHVPTPTYAPSFFLIDFFGLKIGPVYLNTIKTISPTPARFNLQLKPCPINILDFNFYGPYPCIMMWKN